VADTTLHLSPRAIAAIEDGRQVEAIKIVREDNRVDLRAAKQAVDAYVAGSRAFATQPIAAQGTGDDTGSLSQIDDLIAGGNTIAAIKAARDRFGIDLQAAKAWVGQRSADGATPPPEAGDRNTMADRTRPAPAFPTISRDRRGGTWLWIVVALAVAGAVAWWVARTERAPDVVHVQVGAP
jgi:ribosomal protein L7/L12